MTLPEPGDLNWGSPLNDAILAAQADAASAKADASSARSTAIDAHSTAQSVKEFVEAPVDEQIAAKVAEADSASQGAVDDRIDAKVPAATEGVAGKVPLATEAEAAAGTETAKAVTPAGVKAAVDPIRDITDPTFQNNLATSTADSIEPGETDPQAAVDSRADGRITAAAGVTVKAYRDQDAKRRLALRRFNVAMATIDSAPVKISTETDSIGEGYNLGAGWSKSDRPMNRLLAELNARVPVSGAPGAGPYQPVVMVESSSPATDWPWINDGNVSTTAVGFGIRSRLFSGSQSCTYTISGATKVRIFYAKSNLAGTMRITLDAGTPVTIVQNDVAVPTDGFYYDVALPDTGSHSIKVDAASGVVFCHGAMPFNGNETQGWQLYEGGHSGGGTKIFTASSPFDCRKLRRDQFTTVQPHLYYLQLGPNDFASADSAMRVSAATFKTNVQNMIADVRTATTIDPSIVLGAVWELTPSVGVTPIDPWGSYREALYEIAAGDDDIVVYDAAQRVRTGPVLDSARGMLSDNTHLSIAGSRVWARDFATFLLGS